ncbi:MAG: UDP-N-acetylmuramate--L-alanine ligase [Oscillospiraceae bacterium]|jgi:UDP-N-acetylmuramate--alanine ligase|nr:UDP-N-acetylmuramate--L-alanine ligase [Oscillospiraceae bacterium]
MEQAETIDQVLARAKRIHFIGIGGSGMCPLAEILHKEGCAITGSDNNESETLGRVRAFAARVTLTQKAENIQGADMIVFTAALLQDNPELAAAKASGIPTFERASLLGAITRRYQNSICVCGTHGKTTTSAMLTQLMLQAGLSPSAVIGGRLPLTNSNGLAGGSEHLICEACEFQDTFLQLAPDVAVLLNVDEDHMEYFKTLENLMASFRKFASMASKAVIYNCDDRNTRRVLDGAAVKRLIPFGRSEEAFFRAVNVTMEGAFARYDLHYHGEYLTGIRLSVPGEHNVSNSLAAIAAAMFSGASILDCEKGAEAFRGAGRRFEFLGEYGAITLADDYAHHPKELEVTLAAAKQMGYRRVWAVFQPFTYSRTALLLDDFARALATADRVVLTRIMGAREINTFGVETAQLAAKLPGSVWFNEFDEVAEYVCANAAPGDLVLTLGCGDIYKAGKLMAARLKASQSTQQQSDTP